VAHVSGRQWAVLAGAMLFLGTALGYFVAERADGPPGRGSVDVGFLYDMIGHHEQALQMASIDLGSGRSTAVRPFAQEILLFQSYEIGLMEQKLASWGHARADRPPSAMAWMPGNAVPVDAMPGMASPEELARLGDVEGDAVDALFVRLMQDHHLGGVHMAEYAAEHAADEWVRALAARMARNQRTEVAELEAAASRAGLPDDPPGYEPAVIPDDHHQH
jgi:uncharacterized protein (DUF305 family)